MPPRSSPTTVTPDQTWRKKIAGSLLFPTTSTRRSRSSAATRADRATASKDYEQAFIRISDIPQVGRPRRGLPQESRTSRSSISRVLPRARRHDLGSELRNVSRELERRTMTAAIRASPRLLQKLNDGVLVELPGTREPVRAHARGSLQEHLVRRRHRPVRERRQTVPVHGLLVPPKQLRGRVRRRLQRGPCIGEEIVDLPSKGAIASWASCGYELLPTDCSPPLERLARTRACSRGPPRDPLLSDRGARVVSEAIERARRQLRQLVQPGSPLGHHPTTCSATLRRDCRSERPGARDREPADGRRRPAGAAPHRRRYAQARRGSRPNVRSRRAGARPRGPEASRSTVPRPSAHADAAVPGLGTSGAPLPHLTYRTSLSTATRA